MIVKRTYLQKLLRVLNCGDGLAFILLKQGICVPTKAEDIEQNSDAGVTLNFDPIEK